MDYSGSGGGVSGFAQIGLILTNLLLGLGFLILLWSLFKIYRHHASRGPEQGAKTTEEASKAYFDAIANYAVFTVVVLGVKVLVGIFTSSLGAQFTQLF